MSDSIMGQPRTTWTTRQLAEKATRRGKRITRERVRQLCESGEIRANKPGRDWLIPAAEAERWLRRWLEAP